MSIPKTLIVTFAVTALALAGCNNGTVKDDPTATSTSAAGGTSTAVAGQAESSVNVDMKEFSLSPGRTSVPSGEISFRALNSGTIEHELRVIRTDLDPKQLPMQSGGAQVDTSKVDERLALTGVNAGQSKTEKVRLAAGKYVLLCNVAAHYQSGMAAPFTVTP
jgi:uncharacterized cupredoxin-like copper-binding protein